jgi:hypothetical protein
LNKQDIVTGGFEQLRYDAQTSTADPILTAKFPAKLFYAYGINFFSSVTLRF